MIGPLDRGETTTRVEAFVDGAFAFALTLLAISGDHIPTSIDELIVALKGLPAYAASFALVVKVWSSHVQWSRTFGLDDGTTRRLSLLLVFLVLVFVYPLRMVFSAFFSAITAHWLPTSFTVQRLDQIPVLFITYGVAFGSLGAVMYLLYRHAWRLRDVIGLSPGERVDTQARMTNWAVVALVSAMSIVSALVIPPTEASGLWIGFPGFLYFILSFLTPVVMRRARRQQARLDAS